MCNPLAVYKEKNEKNGWTGRVFSFSDGSLHLDKDGRGTLIFDDDDMSYIESNESEDNYRGAVILYSELIQLRNFLNETFPKE